MKTPLNKIKKHYKGTIKNFDKEEVHQFRVGVKKLRALIRMISDNKPGESNKVPAHIKGLYRSTGNIRNLQLQEERVIQFSFTHNVWLENYINFLSSNEKARKLEASKFRNIKAVASREAKHIRKGLKDLDKDQLKTYALHQLGLLQNILLVEHFEDSDLHELRKLLKDVLYNWKHIKKFIILQLPFLLKKKVDIETFTILLGEYQDACMAIEFVKREFYPFPENSEKIMLECFHEELVLLKLHLKKRILNIIALFKIPTPDANNEKLASH